MSKSLFCSLAFKGITIKTDKSITPCCGLQDWNLEPNSTVNEMFNSFNSTALQSLRESLIEGKFPKVCQMCEFAELTGRISMREIWNKYYFSMVSQDQTMNKQINSSDVYAIDISTGADCNSKCMTCLPYSSNFWVDEYNHIWKESFKEGTAPLTKVEIEQFLHFTPNISKITFTGGESTIGNVNLDTLQYLIKTKRSKRIDLTYTTNLTGFTKEMFDMWKEFRSVNLNLSIDALGKINDYIRYPFKWEKINNSLNDLLKISDGKKFSFSLSVTASVFNALHTHELLDYVYELTKNNKWQPGVFINYAVNPQYVDIGILPYEYRISGIEELKKLKSKLINDKELLSIDNTLMMAGVESMLDHLENRHITDPTQHTILLKYFVNKSDKFRKRNIADYIPNLHDLLKQYD
jgi:MoaA/NifB/PqqE/SkfB family radical SAM enzyme